MKGRLLLAVLLAGCAATPPVYLCLPRVVSVNQAPPEPMLICSPAQESREPSAGSATTMR